jgi:Zn-finger nucleic acid-binding protein
LISSFPPIKLREMDKPCPACGTTTLALREELGVTYLECGVCEGSHFSAEGLSAYVVASLSPDVAHTYRTLLDAALERAPREATSIRACPVCGRDLVRLGFGYMPFAIVDRCPQDGGMWLDREDLSRVVGATRHESLVD